MSKKLLLIATGGTIASRPAEDGLTPEMTSEELLQCIPEVRSLCEIDTVQPFNLDSTNMRPQNWVELVKIIRDKYESYDGFVITHGTDTMAYAAATLYYLIQNSPKPVVLTGSQVSIYARDTDARENLRNAITYAADDDACGIHLVFDNKVICANRAQKTRTRSFNAFSSIDYPEVAVISASRSPARCGFMMRLTAASASSSSSPAWRPAFSTMWPSTPTPLSSRVSASAVCRTTITTSSPRRSATCCGTT